MPFVTTLTMQSGDRPALEAVVESVREDAERKGVEIRGPNPEPVRRLGVPQHKRLAPDEGDDRYEPWPYPVSTRTITIVGHESFARSVAERDFPDGVHVEVSVEQVTGTGG